MLRLQEFDKRATEVCSKDVAAVQQQYKGLQGESAAQFLCLDLTFCHTLLTKGYQLPKDSKITLVKQVEYNGQNIEAAWPLGAALDDLSS
jgi:apyrase